MIPTHLGASRRTAPPFLVSDSHVSRTQLRLRTSGTSRRWVEWRPARTRELHRGIVCEHEAVPARRRLLARLRTRQRTSTLGPAFSSWTNEMGGDQGHCTPFDSSSLDTRLAVAVSRAHGRSRASEKHSPRTCSYAPSYTHRRTFMSARKRAVHPTDLVAQSDVTKGLTYA